MKLFAGLSRTDYQDLFRAMGGLVDARGLQNVRFWEHEAGIVLQGQTASSMSGDGRFETILLTDADLQALLTEAYELRAADA
jgi:hypothetical protein